MLDVIIKTDRTIETAWRWKEAWHEDTERLRRPEERMTVECRVSEGPAHKSTVSWQ